MIFFSYQNIYISRNKKFIILIACPPLEALAAGTRVSNFAVLFVRFDDTLSADMPKTTRVPVVAVSALLKMVADFTVRNFFPLLLG